MSVNLWAKRLNQVVQPTPEIDLKLAVRAAIATQVQDDSIIEGKHTPETVEADAPVLSDSRKLSQLVDENFPFDESQLAAIEGMVTQRYACLTGAAGTGKTTTTKKLVDTLLSQEAIDYVDMTEYWRKAPDPEDPDDSYEQPDDWIPSVALVGFTGRSAQMIKRNFPRDWHGNIMTIHRLLAFAPEYYDKFDDDSGEYKPTMRFSPQYTDECLLPWDIIIIDEAGMVGLDLWHQLWDAMKPGCRVYMIGDINQLPPVHGRSVFGFAMAKWPSFELTHIHRQVGTDNPIVDNAWRVLQGQQPVSGGKFQMIELKGDAGGASRHVRGMLPKLVERGVYDPIRDTIITPINGNEGSRGFQLGQLPLNLELALMFNPSSLNPRYIIDGGRERKQFAVGDKVMATKNDHDAGITNGMTGIITHIATNPAYAGDHRRFGTVEEVNAYINDADDSGDNEDFTLESLQESMAAQEEGKEAGKEKKDRGPSSHIIGVRFGDEEHGFELMFSSLSEVGSLMTAYVVTCHKMQGGEAPTIIIICHDVHKQMLYREWLYTAITRASQRCILLYTPMALRTALIKQNIKGTTLAQKVESFNLLQKDNGLGKAINVRLPENESFGSTAVAFPIGGDAARTKDLSGSGLVLLPVSAGSVDSYQCVPHEEEIETLYAEEIPEDQPPAEVIREVHHHYYHTETVVVQADQPKKDEWAERATSFAALLAKKASRQVDKTIRHAEHYGVGTKPFVELYAPQPKILLLTDQRFIDWTEVPQWTTLAQLAPAPKPVNAWAAKLRRPA